MKTEREIRDKIEELMDKVRIVMDTDKREAMYGNIDALLWVIGDKSGEPI